MPSLAKFSSVFRQKRQASYVKPYDYGRDGSSQRSRSLGTKGSKQGDASRSLSFASPSDQGNLGLLSADEDWPRTNVIPVPLTALPSSSKELGTEPAVREEIAYPDRRTQRPTQSRVRATPLPSIPTASPRRYPSPRTIGFRDALPGHNGQIWKPMTPDVEPKRLFGHQGRL